MPARRAHVVPEFFLGVPVCSDFKCNVKSTTCLYEYAINHNRPARHVIRAAADWSDVVGEVGG